MTEAEQIEQQAETIKALWFRNERLQKRCDAQQDIIDRLERENHQLENPHWRAEAQLKQAIEGQ